MSVLFTFTLGLCWYFFLGSWHGLLLSGLCALVSIVHIAGLRRRQWSWKRIAKFFFKYV